MAALGGSLHPDPVTGDLVDPSEISIQNGPPVSVGDKATFGGNVKCCPTNGQFRYIDHAAAEDIKATNMTLLNISDGPCGADTHATFFFEANENGVPGQHFRVDVDDCGEPGSQNPPSNAGPDMLTIQKLPVGYTAGGPLVGGNVQIHKS